MENYKIKFSHLFDLLTGSRKSRAEPEETTPLITLRNHNSIISPYLKKNSKHYLIDLCQIDIQKWWRRHQRPHRQSPLQRDQNASRAASCQDPNCSRCCSCSSLCDPTPSSCLQKCCGPPRREAKHWSLFGRLEDPYLLTCNQIQDRLIYYSGSLSC